MPRLRRLAGQDIRKILEGYGFEVVRIKGSHHIMRRVITVSEDSQTTETQTITVPIHGKQAMPIGTLKSIVRSLSDYLSQENVDSDFYEK